MTTFQLYDYKNEKDELLSLVNKHGLQLNPERVEINESGMDFLVAFTTDDKGTSWVLRKPRRSDVWEKSRK